MPKLNRRDFDVIVVGSSTGGPPVLEKILSALPGDISQPIVVAQHMPLLFTQSMAARLDELCRLRVVHGETGLPLVKSHVYIAPGGKHARVRKAGIGQQRLEVSPQPRDALYKPSVNELFASAAEACGSRVLAIVLTGMGEDGLEGGRTLRDKNATIVAQDHASCVVYGMPKAVTQAALVIANLSPNGMIQFLKQLSPSASDAPTKLVLCQADAARAL